MIKIIVAGVTPIIIIEMFLGLHKKSNPIPK